MSRALYRIVLAAALPLVWLRLAWRARREPEYGRRRAERFGRVPDNVRAGAIWFHTVSAGETIAAAPLIRRLADAHAHTDFLVTTMTPTGSAQVVSRLGDTVMHCYAPYDFGFAVRRFYARVRPRLLVLMETELWPNLIAEARSRGIPVLLVNARLSERSARGYARVSTLTRYMLGHLDTIACQSEAHAQRFIELGAPRDQVTTAGSVKFDVSLPDDFASTRDALAQRFKFGANAQVWIAASTHPGEDEAVLAAHGHLRERFPGLRLVLVPRHPVRAPAVAALIESAGYSHVCASEPGPADAAAEVVLVDVMGVLLQFYALAQVAFVGGTLVDAGGHNPLEPAVCSVPVVCGPHQFNFTDVMDRLAEGGGLFTVNEPEQLAGCIGDLLADPARAQAAGAAGARVVAAGRGATDRLFDLIDGRIRAAAQ